MITINLNRKEECITNVFTILLMLLLTLTLLTSCSKDDDLTEDIEVVETEEEAYDPDFVPTDWNSETHSKDADPNFDEVFDDTKVKRLDFVISSSDWQSMLDDMTDQYGTFGASGGFGPGLTDTGEDPIFVPADIFYNGIQWYRVGVRFKGNSSLQNSWRQGILKLSFKMDFDEYEDTYPQIDNQRFYGFKKFSLKNNYDDKSMLREKVSADVFADAGLAVSHTAFYTLYLDHGDGPEYFGLYTLVEEVDGTVLDTQFSDDDGNLYKPEEDGATFASGLFNIADFEKKNNEDEADWSDVQSLFDILHDQTRTTQASEWRANLEKVFDTDVFLEYLAVNTVIQNWDTYGIMPHNYYLYNNPDNGKLTWIPWDNNEALQEGKMGGALDLDFSDLTPGKWPLIEYLHADETYQSKYKQYLQETIDGPFETVKMQALYTQYANLIEEYATSEVVGYTFLDNDSDFQQTVAQLIQHAENRRSAAENYLD